MFEGLKENAKGLVGILYAIFEIILTSLFMAYPLMVITLISSVKTDEMRIAAIVGSVVVGLYIIFDAMPKRISKMFGWDQWQSLTVGLASISLMTGIPLLLILLQSKPINELLALSITYLSAMLVIIPNAVKNLRDVFKVE